MTRNLKYFSTTTIYLCVALSLFAQEKDVYTRQIAQWDKERTENLKKENGWLNLVGLYWLSPGKNSFGTGKENNIVFPAGTIAAKAGYFEWNDSAVTLVVYDGVDVKIKEKQVSRAILFGNSIENPPIVTSGHLRWTIIKRGEKTGIRLRDLESPAVAQFKGVPRFAADSSWRVTATIETANEPSSIAITNVLGQTSRQKSAGKLSFMVKGQSYSLEALDEGDQLFIIFADGTNDAATYPSGRFLYARKPDASGKTILDFNKAQNPPCAFTSYATCPLPPASNHLPIDVTAGEQYAGTHH